LGIIHSINYSEGTCPPALPIAIVCKFKNYTGPSLQDNIPGLVPIPPVSSFSEKLGYDYERTQFPIKLAWAITIHKSQGLTLDQVWIDLESVPMGLPILPFLD